MAVTFNDKATPKIKTENFKIYFDVSTTSTPEYELQGRGVASWTIDNGQDIESKADVLGFNDFERGVAQPTQDVTLGLRKNSKLGAMIFDAWFKGDLSSLDSLNILQKFEFIDGETAGTCKARLQDECAINVTSFEGEAGGYLAFGATIHYSNKITTGTMTKVDGSTIEFIPDKKDDTNL